MIRRITVFLLAILLASVLFHSRSTAQQLPNGDQLIAEYFRRETRKVESNAFSEISTLSDWKTKRPEYLRQLHEMLGLDPLPEKTDLAAKVTGTIEQDEFVVERLHFQSLPGLYVTANLYRPKVVDEPLPTVLYVCGHGRSKTDGRSNGNKAHYQHHGAWFARNGYICLTIDTIQLGEFEGIHHGTHREKMWWWNNRGYTPAGVEAWNCIRALDYLESRSEVDPKRIGVTGRSGGGAYSWWIAALDERIQVAVPVAGITNLQNHVVDGCVEGHCDCMFMVNTYRWDYAMVASLVAPRSLLISNTDKDRIFPLDGVVDVHSKVKRIYDLYKQPKKLGLHITEGPHKDTQELRVHAFRWMNRWLKDDDSLIESVATKYFEPDQLRVLDELPNDEIVTSIHETFVPFAKSQIPESDASLERAAEDWIETLASRVFRGWPSEKDHEDLDVQMVNQSGENVIVRKFLFNSQTPYRLPFWVMHRPEMQSTKISDVHVYVCDHENWQSVAEALQNDGKSIDSQLGASEIRVYFAPRGIGPTNWTNNERERTHIRRRFMLLGQTLASMQIWDIRRLLQALDSLPEFNEAKIDLAGQGDAAFWSMYASVFEPNVDGLTLTNLPASNRNAPPLLNVSRFVSLPQVLAMAAVKSPRGITLELSNATAGKWNFVSSHPVLRNRVSIKQGP